MSEYGGNNHCHECDGLHGKHYPGYTYEGSSGRAGFGGSDLGKAIFFRNYRSDCGGFMSPNRSFNYSIRSKNN